ncbi:MAG: hypothetical protein M1833_004640 [Piccolia ochrophora]|nr:MAG: hypothetical protein M1833_004640 [Piccolia ochrophora]
MAHASGLSELTVSLVSSILHLSHSEISQKYNARQIPILQTLQSHKYARTDQFAVQDRLLGLNEKLRILDHDELADLLADRHIALSNVPRKWIPELLSLLLELSDQPWKHVRTDELETVAPQDTSSTLTWADIIADDPLKGELWDDVDFAAESSDEDVSQVDPDTSIFTAATFVSTNEESDNDSPARPESISRAERGLEELTTAQAFIGKASTESTTVYETSKGGLSKELWTITELQATREALFMLQGLPTSLFEQHDDGSITVVKRYSINHASANAFHLLLKEYASIGSHLNALRQWASRSQIAPLMQTLRAAVEQRLRQSDSQLSNIQSRFMKRTNGVVVSLLDILGQIQPSNRHLLQIADTFSRAAQCDGPSSLDFTYLELLFEQTCNNQATGADDEFLAMAELFFECFQTYLKPIKRWMQDGELLNGDNSLFISRTDEGTTSPKDLLWHHQYVLRRSSSGQLHAPNFLHAAANKILNTGKSVIFLDRLCIYHDVSESQQQEPTLDFETVFKSSGTMSLAPFSEVFHTAFDNWLSGLYSTTTLVLRDALFAQCGLWTSLDALEYIYFFKDGGLASNLASTLFDKIDRGKEAWNDQFLLTELAQNTFGSLSCVNADDLTIQSLPGRYGDVQNRRRSVKILSSVILKYTIYQRISTFLLQTLRATYILSRLRLRSTASSTPTPLFYSLRHRLLWLANTLHTHLTITVFIPSTTRLRTALAAAGDVEAMVSAHAAHIARLETQCLLSHPLAPIHQALISLLDLSILLADTYTLHASENPVFDTSTRSLSLHISQILPYRARRGRQRRKPRSSSPSVPSSSDEEDDDDDNAQEVDPDTSYISFSDTPYTSQLRRIAEQYERLRAFVCHGLRGVARAAPSGEDGGGASWEILAERLEGG